MEENGMKVISNDLFGRLDIYATSDEITADNVIDELNTPNKYEPGFSNSSSCSLGTTGRYEWIH